MEAVAEALYAVVLGEAGIIDLLREADAFFELLQNAGDADFYELIEVAGGDGEELDAL
jgi:hypothetical protein